MRRYRKARRGDLEEDFSARVLEVSNAGKVLGSVVASTEVVGE